MTDEITGAAQAAAEAAPAAPETMTAAGGEGTPAPTQAAPVDDSPPVITIETVVFDKLNVALAAATASYERAAQEREEGRSHIATLAARVIEFEGMLAAGAAKAEAEAETVFESAEDEAAALKKRLVAMIEEAKSLSSRLADIVVHPAVHPAMAFHSAVSSLKVLFGELL